jgi:catechol-2,3-dioxygenase
MMATPPPAQLTHVGLYVTDMDRMVGFYNRLLGLVVTDEGEFLGNRLTFMSRDADEHHQIVFVTGRNAPTDIKVLSQVSFRLVDDDLTALRWIHETALELGAQNMEGRNHGNSWSLYFEDPEGNRLEVYTATPWYVSQPWRVPLDLAESDEVIREKTLAQVNETATWSPVEVWRQQMAARLDAAAPR